MGMQAISLLRSFQPGLSIVKPTSVKEIQQTLRYANRHRIPVKARSSSVDPYRYPTSKQGLILIDLSEMRTIHNVDTRNRAVRFEPGVGWAQLQDELRKHGLKASNPLLPHKRQSALSSCLEKEPMLIPMFEYGEPILTMEMVLPSGDVFRTGSASGPAGMKKTKADLVGQEGPATMHFSRLFQGAQGTLGIVTWINVKAETLPTTQRLFSIPCNTLEEVVSPVCRIQRRMIGKECFALNNHHLASILCENRQDDFTKLKKDLPPWTIILCLAAGPRLPERKMEYQQEALADIVKELGITLQEGLAGRGSQLIALFQGPWTEDPYWKHGLLGDSLDIFFVTTRNKVSQCESSFHKVLEEYGYAVEDVGKYVQPLEYGRVFHVEFSIPVRPDSRQDGELKSLSRKAVAEISKQGGFFSRPQGIWAEEVFKLCPSNTAAQKTMKKILDKNNIMHTEEGLCL
ncbi:MAG: FAD-binding oxidoreductase [Actinobacteria bacterium]|nr:FAD-binding oxidoreductase [Actinomycetota bacterium]